MSPPGLPGTRSVRRSIEELSSSSPGAPYPPALHKVRWQTREQVYWPEMAEPTMDNILEVRDRVLECAYRERVLVDATREGIQMLRNDPDERLPLVEMVPLLTDWDVCILWSTNTLNEPTDLLFYSHLQTADKDETPSPLSLSFSYRNNRGPFPDMFQSSDADSSDDGMNSESAAAAARRGTRSTTMNSMKRVEWCGAVVQQISTNPYLMRIVFLLSAPIQPVLRFRPHLPIPLHLLVSNHLTLALA